jgi:predicted ATP-dependent endonuclease of OLD family
MKLKSFKVVNYKSVIDSNECRLSDNDNILVLAGQNESGKSSILQALRDYEGKKLSDDCNRDDESNPAISCTYVVEAPGDLPSKDIVDNYKFPKTVVEIIDAIREFTITREFSGVKKYTTYLDAELTLKLKNAFEAENVRIKIENERLLAEAKATHAETDESSSDNEDVKPAELLNINEVIHSVGDALWGYAPKIIFFDDFCDILPDKISIKDLKTSNSKVKGYQAVKNIETILNTDFSKFDDYKDGKRETLQNDFHDEITASFNEKWKQRIAEGNGAKIHIKYNQGKAADASYLNFFIETTRNEFLSPGKRSQGFKWFLSFFLHLKAEDERSDKLIILFDEPGLFLHSKAQMDMIAVFEELALKNQIIYSTHSPYLIDTKKLHRLRLVVNTKKAGSTIEKVTSGKIKNQKDALKPVIDAIGLDVASPFSVAQKHNAILEGISDFYYVQAMAKLLNREYDIGFIPSMGSSNCHLLMELCIGWGLEWVIIFDDKGALKDYNKIKRDFFSDDEKSTDEHIYRLRGFDGIEDLFTADDMKLVNSEADFGTLKNSEVVRNYGGKELYARLFYEKVNSGEITSIKVSKASLKNFGKIFHFIEKTFKIEPRKIHIDMENKLVEGNGN